jgi:hypothetical protein
MVTGKGSSVVIARAHFTIGMGAALLLAGCGGGSDGARTSLDIARGPVVPACRAATVKLARIAGTERLARAAGDQHAIGHGVIATGVVLKRLARRLSRPPDSHLRGRAGLAAHLRVEANELHALGMAIEHRNYTAANALRAQVDRTSQDVRTAARTAGVAGCG